MARRRTLGIFLLFAAIAVASPFVRGELWAFAGLSAVAAGAVLIAQSFRRPTSGAVRGSTTIGVLAVLLTVSFWLAFLAPVFALVGLGLADAARRAGEPVFDALVLNAAALVFLVAAATAWLTVLA